MPLSWRQLAWLASPQANEKRILLRAPQALTISRVDAVLTGGSSPSVSFSLRHGADVSTAGTVVSSSPLMASSANGGSSTGAGFSALLNPQVPSAHWLWVEVTSVSGSPFGLALALHFS
jgi:hypothetical protein